jgi:hypothetical protein
MLHTFEGQVSRDDARVFGPVQLQANRPTQAVESLLHLARLELPPGRYDVRVAGVFYGQHVERTLTLQCR